MSDKPAFKSPIQQSVETKLKAWLKPNSPQPSRLEISVLDRALKYLSIVAKLDAEDFGSDLDDLEETERKAGTDNESGDS